jgi:hypothetical protein
MAPRRNFKKRVAWGDVRPSGVLQTFGQGQAACVPGAAAQAFAHVVPRRKLLSEDQELARLPTRRECELLHHGRRVRVGVAFAAPTGFTVNGCASVAAAAVRHFQRVHAPAAGAEAVTAADAATTLAPRRDRRRRTRYLGAAPANTTLGALGDDPFARGMPAAAFQDASVAAIGLAEGHRGGGGGGGGHRSMQGALEFREVRRGHCWQPPQQVRACASSDETPREPEPEIEPETELKLEQQPEMEPEMELEMEPAEPEPEPARIQAAVKYGDEPTRVQRVDGVTSMEVGQQPRPGEEWTAAHGEVVLCPRSFHPSWQPKIELWRHERVRVVDASGTELSQTRRKLLRRRTLQGAEVSVQSSDSPRGREAARRHPTALLLLSWSPPPPPPPPPAADGEAVPPPPRDEHGAGHMHAEGDELWLRVEAAECAEVRESSASACLPACLRPRRRDDRG